MPTLDVGPGPLEYELIDGAGPALVFLHEGLGSIRLWRTFPRDLCEATGRAGLVYSRHGHGSSAPYARPRTSRFMHDEALAILPRVLEALGLVEPVLVGHSDGASIAIIHAASHPAKGVVAMTPHVFIEDVTLAGIRGAVRAFEAGPLRERLSRHHDDVDLAFAGWSHPWLSGDHSEWTLEAEVAALTVPVLVVQGDADEYGTLAQVDTIANRAGGRVETLVLPGVGHGPHFERPDEVLAAVAAFVRSL